VVASSLLAKCYSQGIGVAIRRDAELHLVVVPKHKIIVRTSPEDAVGHIPDWILERLVITPGLSRSLQRAASRLTQKYNRLRRRRSPDHDTECQILDEFSRDLEFGDRRLFFPRVLLAALLNFERSRAVPTKRDHFFHTFNNLFLGFILLSEAFPDRSQRDVPDRFVAPATGQPTQHVWESLWALTCLFHDRGYVAEEMQAGLAYNFGLTGQKFADEVQPIQDAIADGLQNAWEREFREARRDLLDLINSLSRNWSPQEFRNATNAKLEEALRKIYFDGKKCGHSLISGLTIIKHCATDRVAPTRTGFDKIRALTACEIAALSMIFHDAHARTQFSDFGFAPIPFEDLPYASALVFVDALQEDRRDISKMRFPKHSVLQSIAVDPARRTVTAKVDLRRIKLEYRAWKIDEFAEVLSWLARGSSWKFAINYLESIGGHQT
jgi:hypothetical protein